MKTVVIFGGSGFVGQHITRRIAKNGHKIVIPYQTQVNEAKLRLFGYTGQIIPLYFRSMQEKKISQIIDKADVVINLKTLWDERKISYSKGILDFNVNLIKIINKVKKPPLLIFFSGIGVDLQNDSNRSKAILQSENYIQKNMNNAIIVRPGVVIGGGDKFLINLMKLFKISFFIPLFGKGFSKFQPVFIDDLSLGIKKIIDTNLIGHHLFEFVGPDIFTYREFYNYLSICINKTRIFVPIPFKIVKIIVTILEKTSFSPLNSEQLKLFEKDNISSNNHKKLEFLGIVPQDLKQIVKNIIKKNP